MSQGVILLKNSKKDQKMFFLGKSISFSEKKPTKFSKPLNLAFLSKMRFESFFA